MNGITDTIVQDHQHTLLAEASRARMGNRLARRSRLALRADRAVARLRRASAQSS